MARVGSAGREDGRGDAIRDSGVGYGNALCWSAGKGPDLGERYGEVVSEVSVSKLEPLAV